MNMWEKLEKRALLGLFKHVSHNQQDHGRRGGKGGGSAGSFLGAKMSDTKKYSGKLSDLKREQKVETVTSRDGVKGVKMGGVNYNTSRKFTDNVRRAQQVSAIANKNGVSVKQAHQRGWNSDGSLR